MGKYFCALGCGEFATNKELQEHIADSHTTNTPKSKTSLDEIFDSCGDWSGDPEQYYFDEEAAKKLIEANYISKEQVLKAIGEDDPRPSTYYVNSDALAVRNQLRKEIRSALKLGGEL